MERLPNELHIEILSYLDWHDQTRVAEVCDLWSDLLALPEFQPARYDNKFPWTINEDDLGSNHNTIEAYLGCSTCRANYTPLHQILCDKGADLYMSLKWVYEPFEHLAITSITRCSKDCGKTSCDLTNSPFMYCDPFISPKCQSYEGFEGLADWCSQQLNYEVRGPKEGMPRIDRDEVRSLIPEFKDFVIIGAPMRVVLDLFAEGFGEYIHTERRNRTRDDRDYDWWNHSEYNVVIRKK